MFAFSGKLSSVNSFIAIQDRAIFDTIVFVSSRQGDPCMIALPNDLVMSR